MRSTVPEEGEAVLRCDRFEFRSDEPEPEAIKTPLMGIQEYLALPKQDRVKIYLDRENAARSEQGLPPERWEDIRYRCHWHDLAIQTKCPFLGTDRVSCHNLIEWINCEDVMLEEGEKEKVSKADFERRKAELVRAGQAARSTLQGEPGAEEPPEPLRDALGRPIRW